MDAPFRSPTSPFAVAGDAARAERLAFLRRVYLLLTGSVVSAALGAAVALNAGAGVSQTFVPVGRGQSVAVPPLVAFFANHWFVGPMLFLGAFFFASAVREKPGLNVAALMGATGLSGVYIGPALFWAQLSASQGHTLSASPIRDAFLLAVAGFVGLSAYALGSRRDFSFLGGFLSMGLWVLIGASLLSMFVGGQAFSLAIASAGVLLFGGYVLYDTARLARDPSQRDAVGAAIGLYLNLMNLFLFLLRILGSGRRDD